MESATTYRSISPNQLYANFVGRDAPGTPLV